MVTFELQFLFIYQANLIGKLGSGMDIVLVHGDPQTSKTALPTMRYSLSPSFRPSLC